MEDEQKNIKVITSSGDKFNWIVPRCCQEGLDSCPHTVKRKKKKLVNKGL
jgi:hypothetical protein